MASLNRATIIGNCGNDPEVRYTPSGTAVTTISVATSSKYTDKQSGEKKERTEWHNIVFWGRLAEIAGEYLKKGSSVYVEGEIRTEKWQDKGGADHYTTKIHASAMQLLGGQRQSGASQAQVGGGGQAQHRGQPVKEPEYDLDDPPF